MVRSWIAGGAETVDLEHRKVEARAAGRSGLPAADVAGWGGRVLGHPLAFVAAFLALYGWNHEDYRDFALLTRDPFVTHPEAMRQFLHSSPLPFFVGWPFTAAFGPHASYTIVVALGFALMLYAGRLRLRDIAGDRRAFVAVLFSTPLLLVLSRWLGKNDPYLLGFFLLGQAWRERPLRSAAAASLLVVSHRELGLIMLACDAILRRDVRVPRVVGAALGVAAVALYHRALSEPPFSRADLALLYLRRGLEGWEALPASHAMLSFTWFWMVLFLRGSADDGLRLGTAVLLCFAVSLDGADYTRDFILCAFPVVVYVAEGAARDARISALLTGRSWPYPFLIQMQLEGFDRITESQWLGRLLSRLVGALHALG